MNKDQIQMIAETVRQHRKAKGYTQKEVSELSKVSLRSIQRIENGEVNPRMYTVKVLADCLNFSLDFLNDSESQSQHTLTDRPSKIILSLGSTLLLVLVAIAFLSQSAGFPETSFEALVFWACIVLILTLLQFKIWKPVK